MTRANVKAVLDYLLGRQINLEAARAQVLAMGIHPHGELEKFLAGTMSYQDVFSAWGV